MNTTIKNLRYGSSVALALMAGIFASCTPEENDMELGPKASSEFTVTPVEGKTNTYLLSSTDPNAFLFRWDKGDGAGARLGSKVDTAYFEQKGDYTVKLTAFGPGGHGEAKSQTIRVENTDLNACSGNKKILTGDCGTKTWVLAPQPGALHIGPPEGGTWWGSSQADVTDDKRTCLFNDEYTFSANGSFVFDDKGDMRVDDEGGNPFPTDIGLEIGCYSMDQIPDKYKAWGSGNFAFQITGQNLKLTGVGAHMGLYKVGDAGGAVSPPAPSVTYKIMELTEDKLVIEKRYDWGVWTFTFVPKG